VVMRRAKKHKNLSSARHDDQIGFHFRTAKTQLGHGQSLPLTVFRGQSLLLIGSSPKGTCHVENAGV
jgi:hypothetical protein